MNIIQPNNFTLFNNHLININSIESISIYPKYSIITSQPTIHTFTITYNKTKQLQNCSILATISIFTQKEQYIHQYFIPPANTPKMFLKDNIILTQPTNTYTNTKLNFTITSKVDDIQFLNSEVPLNTNFLNTYDTQYQTIFTPILQQLNIPNPYPPTPKPTNTHSYGGLLV